MAGGPGTSGGLVRPSTEGLPSSAAFSYQPAGLVIQLELEETNPQKSWDEKVSCCLDQQKSGRLGMTEWQL